MRRFALCTFLAFAFSAVCAAQSTPGYRLKVRTFAELANEQRRIVLGYCRADFEGARLVANGFEKMRPFVSYRTNPEFGSFDVVSRFEVLLPEQPGDVVSANYRVVGRWETGTGWTPQSTTESVQFRVVEREGDLMINEIAPGEPRVSARAALVYLKQQISATTSQIERGMMQKGIDALSVMIAPPPTTAPPSTPKP